MKCPDCGSTFKGKICPCGYSKGKTSKRDEIVRCPRCSLMRRSKYMKSYGNEEICSNCLTAQHIPANDIEYYRTLASKYGFKLYDIETHVRAANKLGVMIDDYLASLPKSLEEYKAYWKDKTPEMGGVALI